MRAGPSWDMGLQEKINKSWGAQPAKGRGGGGGGGGEGAQQAQESVPAELIACWRGSMSLHPG